MLQSLKCQLTHFCLFSQNQASYILQLPHMITYAIILTLCWFSVPFISKVKIANIKYLAFSLDVFILPAAVKGNHVTFTT